MPPDLSSLVWLASPRWNWHHLIYSSSSWLLCWEPYCLEMEGGEQKRGVSSRISYSHKLHHIIISFFFPFSLHIPLPLPSPSNSLTFPSPSPSLSLFLYWPLPFHFPSIPLPRSSFSNPLPHSLPAPPTFAITYPPTPPFLSTSPITFPLPLYSDTYDSSSVYSLRWMLPNYPTLP